MNWQDTCKVIPEGVQTLSKRPCVHVDGVYPKWIVRGNGCHVWDIKGNKYIDYPCSLGANVLGHANPEVVKAIKVQVDNGTLFSLGHPMETELAELLASVIPVMESVRFVKTGSESCSAAVRVARAYTGRDPILCCGYHGWHEWYNCTTPKNAGSIKQDVTPVKWGDLPALEKLLIEKKPAAFITEPYVYAKEEAVSKWLKEARRLCTAHDVLLIFDENVTGFRTRKLTASNYWRVEPDLICLGKAMANGVPMAAFGGKREIMDVLKGDCFVSSTFGGDLLGISAAIATITQLKQVAAIEHIWMAGGKIKAAFNMAATSDSLEGVKCIGLPPRTHFIFPTAVHKGLFWQECLKQNIFFGHAQFVSYRHRQLEIDQTCSAMRHALRIVRKNWENPEARLEGKPPEETLRVVTVPAEVKPPAQEPAKATESHQDTETAEIPAEPWVAPEPTPEEKASQDNEDVTKAVETEKKEPAKPKSRKSTKRKTGRKK